MTGAGAGAGAGRDAALLTKHAGLCNKRRQRRVTLTALLCGCCVIFMERRDAIRQCSSVKTVNRHLRYLLLVYYCNQRRVSKRPIKTDGEGSPRRWGEGPPPERMLR